MMNCEIYFMKGEELCKELLPEELCSKSRNHATELRANFVVRKLEYSDWKTEAIC